MVYGFNKRRIHTAEWTEIQWRILREECKKNNCFWHFSDDGKPKFPTGRDCSETCRKYLEREVEKKFRAKKHGDNQI